jgi:hypothetical protein
MASKIVLTWTDDGTTGDYIQFSINKKITPATKIIQREDIVNNRLASYQITAIVTLLFPNGTWSASYFWNYFNQDYNLLIDGIRLYQVTRVGRVVTIEFTEDKWDFSDVLFSYPGLSVVITNTTTAQFTLDSDVIGIATIPCDNVRVTLTTSLLATSYSWNRISYPNTQNPLVIDFPRGVPFYIVMATDIHSIDNQTLRYPEDGSSLLYGVLSVANTVVTITQTMIGATVTFSVDNSDNLVLEWSLDDIAYFPITDILTGQTEDNYTVWIRDQFGCKVSVDYTIDAFGTYDPIMYLSKANSINFYKVETPDNCSIFKNGDNTYSINEKHSYANSCGHNLLTTCDNVTNQFKSNFTTPTAFLRKEGQADIELIVDQKSANLNRFESYDAWMYDYGNGKTGIYFDSGNTYDEFEVAIVGGEFALNGNLPDFGQIGNYVTLIGYGTHKIIDVIYDEDLNRKAIIIGLPYNGQPQTSICKSTYNLLPFEVYEFDTDFVLNGAGIWDVLLINTDSNNPTQYHTSELIFVEEESTDTVLIEYWNDNNRDVFYKWGIKHRIRIPIDTITYSPNADSTINLGDNNAYIVKSEVYDADSFQFAEVATEVMRKLVIALNCEFVLIDGQGYIIEGSIEPERVGTTNLYTLLAKMIKSDIVYSTRDGGADGVDAGYPAFDIPPLLSIGDGFIKL